MNKTLAIFGFVILYSILYLGLQAQNSLAPLTVEKIMRDPKWMGTSPSNPFWDMDGETLYFNWNPDNAAADSLYKINLKNPIPVKLTKFERAEVISLDNMVYNQTHTAATYEKNGDLFYYRIKDKKKVQLTNSQSFESNPGFGFNDKSIIYRLDNNLFSWNILDGTTKQLTNFVTGNESAEKEKTNMQNNWLETDQMREFEVLKKRKADAEERKEARKQNETKQLKKLYTGNKQLIGVQISNDGRFISYRLRNIVSNTRTLIPDYVTESGYTETITGRSKVGQALAKEEFFIYDNQADSLIKIDTKQIPGIYDIPEFYKDYPLELKAKQEKKEERNVNFSSLNWSLNTAYAVLELRAQDNKDRWLMLWDTATKKLSLIDRQHDDAWIGGPGINSFYTGWIDDNNFWFQSEKTGYSHLYIYNKISNSVKAITQGNFEIQQTSLSKNEKYFYVISNKEHPGEKHYYRLQISNGQMEKLTGKEGAYEVALSPDENNMAFLYSYINLPPELFLQPLNKKQATTQITHKSKTIEFTSYNWRVPEVLSFKAEDGEMVYARIYKPKQAIENAPAVLFVHGAGYLQNAHKWWSSYFREYMFNNLLADKGYYVMDIDYRGSAGYGRDWRTGIYRNMGGKDLSDHVDAVKYLKQNFKIDTERVGLYGGSYGGFIALMAMFKNPETFKAGAALRPVTDWAQYNHGYTANILNEPYNDSLAYRRSSPLYYASGLEGNLLIAHGIVDVNVHFQDAVKLSQRLIELGKNNWEIIGYPMEDHGFIEPSSWTDEYKRILKLFEQSFQKTKN